MSTSPDSSAGDPPGAAPRDWTQVIAEAIVGVYYPDAVRAGGAARQRAQAAFGLLSGVLSAITAIAVVRLTPSTWLTGLVGATAVAAWLIATAFFTAAIGSPLRDREPGNANTAEDFVREVLRRSVEEQAWVERRHRLGLYSACAAAVASVAFIATVSISSALSEPGVDSVVLSPRGYALAERSCAALTVGVTNHVPAKEVSIDAPEGFVFIKIPAAACGSDSDVSLSLPIALLESIGYK